MCFSAHKVAEKNNLIIINFIKKFMEQEQDPQKILKSYKTALYVTYGAFIFALVLARLGVSDGLWTDFLVYLFFAIVINIFKNKIATAIIATLSAIQLVFVIISIMAGSSQAIELFISAIVLGYLLAFYKSIKKIGSIKKLKQQYGNIK